jgi:hypothetical protein
MVEVGHPEKASYIAEARIESDMVNSRDFAELLMLDALPQSRTPPPEIAVLHGRLGAEPSLLGREPSLWQRYASFWFIKT